MFWEMLCYPRPLAQCFAAGVCGTSVGALVGLFVVLGLTTAEMVALMDETLPALLRGRNSLRRLLRTGALRSNAAIARAVRRALATSGFSPWTTDLRTLQARTRIPFHVGVCDVARATSETLSATSHPRTLVVDAVLASMAIPLVFPAIRVRGRDKVDGGVHLPFPIGVFPLSRSLVLWICQGTEQERALLSHQSTPQPPPSTPTPTPTASPSTSAGEGSQLPVGLARAHNTLRTLFPKLVRTVERTGHLFFASQDTYVHEAVLPGAAENVVRLPAFEPGFLIPKFINVSSLLQRGFDAMARHVWQVDLSRAQRCRFGLVLTTRLLANHTTRR